MSLQHPFLAALGCVCVSKTHTAQTGPGTPKLESSLGSDPSLEGMLSAPSVSALALCNLLLDAQLEGLLHGWIQRRVCRHLLAHPSWIIVLRGGRVRKLRVWPLPERPPALSLDCLSKNSIGLTRARPAISQVSPVIVTLHGGP